MIGTMVNYANDTIVSDCDFAWRISRHWLFMVGHLSSTFISIMALALLVVIIVQLAIIKSKGDFKFVVISYFSLSLIATFYHFISTLFNLVRISYAKTSCEVIFNPKFSRFGNVSDILFMNLPIICLLILSQDRSVALKNDADYKNNSYYPSFKIAFLILIDILMWCNIFVTDVFSGGTVSFKLLPLGVNNAVFKIFCMLFALIALYFLYNIHMFILYAKFKRRELKATDVEHYQEVAFHSQFILWFVRYSLYIYGWFILYLVLLQSLGHYIFSDKRIHHVFQNATTNILVPTIQSIVVLIAKHLLEKYEARMTVNISRVREELFARQRHEKNRVANLERRRRERHRSAE